MGFIASRRTSWHRRLGWAAAALAVAMAVSGVTSGVLSMRRESAAGYEAAAFLLTALSAMLVFTTLVAAALVWRQ